MDILIITGLLFLGIILFLIELFFIPGIGIAGFAALGCLIYASFFAFTEIGTFGGLITLLAALVLSIAAFVWFMRSRTLDRLSLKEELDSTVDNQDERSISVGQQGITTTRLALIGMADFDGKTVEVKSADGFIDEQTPIEVIRISQGTILVKRKQIP
ncbi:MAG: NfeD family protein [Bacteroidaceae bacterium]|jgi:membrane-bound ClpP family serine protease